LTGDVVGIRAGSNRRGHGDTEKFGDWAVATDHGLDNTPSRPLMQSAEHAYRFKVGSAFRREGHMFRDSDAKMASGHTPASRRAATSAS
jgi:hypothetical protein